MTALTEAEKEEALNAGDDEILAIIQKLSLKDSITLVMYMAKVSPKFCESKWFIDWVSGPDIHSITGGHDD